MTIAAGFLYDGGVLLCSDTQMESGAALTHGPKIGAFDFVGGKAAITFSGNARSSEVTIQKFSKVLRRLQGHEDLIAEFESVLDTQYNRLVYRHPDYRTDNEFGLHYSMIFAVWFRDLNFTYLFETDQTRIVAVDTPYRCTGKGRDLADYLVASLARADMAEGEALVLAAYMLGQVKAGVSGCGGWSHFRTLRHDGTGTLVADRVLSEVERLGSTHDAEARRLLFAMTKGSTEFEAQLGKFAFNTRAVQGYWHSLSQEGSLSQQSTIADLSRQPPSRESPEVSGEP